MSTDPGINSVAGQWTVLRAGAREVGGLEIPSLPLAIHTTAGPVRLAVGPGGEARLLLPVTGGPRLTGIDAGSALAVTESSLMHAGRTLRFLDITCLSHELEPVFGEVVDEVVARVSKGIDCIEAVRTTLEDFRALLTARPPSQVERSRIAGLVAELVVLNRLLDLSASAWRTWRGPVGDRHDFRVADASLEVKASLRAGSVTITIHGLEQLEPASGGSLHLAHFVLEPVSGGPLTIGNLGRRALAQADDPGGLRDLLAACGCPDVHGYAWNRDAFRMESESLYRVEGDFPRMVPSGFRGGSPPPGVGKVTYVVDLSVASAWKCPVGESERLLQAFAR